MYSFTALIVRMIAALRRKAEVLEEDKKADPKCNFCVHAETALRRQETYTCLRCKAVYKRRS